jgi:hypothetical protein
MRALLVLSMVLGVATAFAQGSAGSASAGSAGSGSAGSGSTGSAAPSAGSGSAGSASAPVADPASTPPAPAFDPAAQKKICEDAIAKPPGGDARFVSDVQSLALGQVAAPQLAKTPEGRACFDAVSALEDFRSTVTTVAREKAATELAAEVGKQHEDAAKAIAKNQKHVVLAYAALWLLAAGFLLFLWRRQQHLKTEIANLKRDLEAASK